MIRKIDSKDMGSNDLGWLRSKYHFSFAEYYNQENINFGVLRVINDDSIESGAGFDTHPHKDIEIISYVVDGELTHGDSMENKTTLTRGHVQYMSAGTGVFHNEYNFGKEVLRFLQIWIFPDKERYEPYYSEHRFHWEDRWNKWFLMVSGKTGDAPIKINQDINIYSLFLDKNNEIIFHVNQCRQAYLVQIEGISSINRVELSDKDGMEIIEEDIIILAKESSHILVLEMEQSIRY